MGEEQAFYLHIEGIRGECKDANYKDWIDVLSWEYSVTQPSSMDTGGGGGVGKAAFDDFLFTHFVDRSSPNLMKYSAAARHIPKITLHCHRAGSGSKPYMKVVLTDCIITSALLDGDVDDIQLLEDVGIAYSRIDVEVAEQNADGSMGAMVSAYWDVKENQG